MTQLDVKKDAIKQETDAGGKDATSSEVGASKGRRCNDQVEKTQPRTIMTQRQKKKIRSLQKDATP